jgi:hypothetical protein
MGRQQFGEEEVGPMELAVLLKGFHSFELLHDVNGL